MSENGNISELHNREQLLERLEDVVEAYGTDQSRWLPLDKKVLQPLLSSDREAQRLVFEAAAMDQLLAFSDEPDKPSDNAMEQLSDRIMLLLEHVDEAQAEKIKQAELPASADVIPFPGREKQNQSNAGPVTVYRWGGRAALAASLVIGIFVGANGYLEQTTQSVAALAAGLDFTIEASALIDDGFGGDEEEFL